ncbi:alpha-1,3-glucanase/mutanase [Aspergillus avenaceus]|uniref:Alpha-1,3-glucanase/mutanase n=1 Tax=Aspergillus avenaceus TaxID=36643 RepID=A0A5N6TSS6_ASPAV|nr:alpha-1,3-glucanase/mutanase [Aspergillus avenaceus]
MLFKFILLALLGTLSLSAATPLPQEGPDKGASDRLVFCHFMIGITSNRKGAADYDDDMKLAKGLGIDAFALNIGVDPYTDTQLGYAYESAAKNDMKVFLSFDFNWYNTGQASAVGAKVKQYASLPAQLKVDNKVFVSSFAGDGLDLPAMQSAAGNEVFFAPNFHPGQGDFNAIQGALNWMAWDNNGENKAPTPGRNVSVADGDKAYVDALKGKPYVAPASGWFFTHFGSEVSYSKNWVFPSDLLWYNRWQQILGLSPRFVEIVTWNDYGESHYIGPLSSPHTDDGASKWVMDMPHTGWLEMSKPFIAAYKAGDKSVDKYITDEKLIYWYRPTPRDVNCDSTDTTMQGSPNNASGNFFTGKPNGWETMQDAVFVVALLKSPATITVASGKVSEKFEAQAGASAFTVQMGVGQQKFAVTRDGKTVMEDTSLKDIVDTCICGIYNFNPYVGTVPPEKTIDKLQSDGLAMLTQGLKVPCATNTLGGSRSPAPRSNDTWLFMYTAS